MNSVDIREKFLSFFEGNGHRRMRSHSLIPPDDPTLLFVNAGMVQFKDVFTGTRDIGTKRAVTSQKCLRVSGKHNDLEQVGRTSRHHTFFEMLGNFSFGDYFKREAIEYAWELITVHYGINPDLLWVTVHPDDAEASAIWRDVVGMREERIYPDPSNFWAMGETGPCGPCSEIHIDRGDSFPGRSIAEPGERFVELWNLVFMQFDRDDSGELKPLPAPSIDTGMGLERLAAVLQGKRDNYETDLFMPLISLISEMSGRKFGLNEEDNTAMRVIADHARATAFLIADSVFPENEGRGYVLRRLMRRAIRFGRKLELETGFFKKVCGRVVEEFSGIYDELGKSGGVIEEMVSQEEERFSKTLNEGMRILKEEIEKSKKSNRGVISGRVVFTLYDTHGFPSDLTALIANENGLEIDEKGFLAEMESQKERGRRSWKEKREDFTIEDPKIYDLLKQDDFITKFTGYQGDRDHGKVILLIKDGRIAQGISAGEEGYAVFDKTPFYAESGGQVSDTGSIYETGGGEKVADVISIFKVENAFFHHLKMKNGSILPGSACELVIDSARRNGIRRSHSATHLLHWALRKVLGEHVKQKGSLVENDRLRFDFAHTRKMTAEEIAAVEDLVIEKILENSQVNTSIMPLDDAVKSGAMAFFGEKYGSTVRVVAMGGGESRELCGGTHVRFTGDIGFFKITAESGISAGVRRIEAITGAATAGYIREKERIVSECCLILKSNENELSKKLSAILDERESLKKEKNDLKLRFSKESFVQNKKILSFSDGTLLIQGFSSIEPKLLRELSDQMKKEISRGVIFLYSHDTAGKAAVFISLTKDLSKKFHAGQILKEILNKYKGKGGGSPETAEGISYSDSITQIEEEIKKKFLGDNYNLTSGQK